MERESLVQQAKVRAARYCAGRERAPFQVYEKLISWKLTEEEAEQVLDQLRSEKYIDENRFCRAFCRDKFEFNQWGKVKIRQELFQYRLPEEVVAYGLDQIDPQRYEDRLRQLSRDKWKSLEGEADAWTRKQKTAAYMVRKGYETDLVMDFLNRMSSR